MAGFNEVQHGRIGKFFQRWSGIKGRQPVSSIASEVQPSLSILSGVEDRFLQGWDRYSKGLGVGAQGAGNSSNFRLRNPTGSGAIVVLESIQVSTAALASQVILAIQAINTDQTSTSTGFALDFRTARPLSSAVTSAGLALQLTNAIKSITLAVNTVWEFIWDENQEIPVLPGNCVEIQLGNLNQAMNVSMMWRERTLEDAEKI